MTRRSFVSAALFIVLPIAFAAAPAKISPGEVRALLAPGSGAVLLDVRTREEFEAARIPGALLLPYDAIDARSAAALIPAKDATVIVYCRSGRRSAIAAQELAKLGYRKVRDLGAISDWPYEIAKGPAPAK